MHAQALQLGVRSVTQGGVATDLTATKEHLFTVFGGVFDGRKFGILVRSIAKRRIGAGFTLAQGRRAILVNGKFQRLYSGPGMGSVAKRLAFGSSATAPEIVFACLQIDLRRHFGRYDRHLGYAATSAPRRARS